MLFLPARKTLIAVTIAFLLGAGMTWMLTKNFTQQKQYEEIILPSPTISSYTPSLQPTNTTTFGTSCTSDAVCLLCPPQTEQTYPLNSNCVQGVCRNGFCDWTNTGKMGCKIDKDCGPAACAENEACLPYICVNGYCERGQKTGQGTKCTSSNDCPAGAPCQNGYCIGVDYTQNQPQNCPSGTVRVCEAGECECLQQ